VGSQTIKYTVKYTKNETQTYTREKNCDRRLKCWRL